MFQSPKLTNAGKALYYSNIGGQGITFTTIKLGKGTLSTPIATLTDLIDPVIVIDAALTNNSGNYVDISGAFNNTEMAEGFYWREIGVFAADPSYPDERTKDILYCYQNAYDTADFIPVASVETVEKHITVPLIVGDVENISCILDSSLVFATRQDMNNHIHDTSVHVTSEERNTWNNKQNKIIGTEGQVVVINGDGVAEAQDKDFGLKPRLSITVESGAVVTVSGNGKVFTQISTGGVLCFDLPDYGIYTAVATKNNKTSNTISIDVDTVHIYEISLTFFSATITVNIVSGSTVTCSKSGGIPQTKTSTGTAVFTVFGTGTYTITASKDGKTAEDVVTITSDGQSVTVTLDYVHIYGVQWDGTSSTMWSRTDESAGFTNPVPAVNNGAGNSPFDNLMPWSGMQKYVDAEAGDLVSIPKFWYKWTRSGSTMKLQIADKATAGFYVSPAHQNRGDGSGERDIVYVGRYHCHTSNYKSISGDKPKANISRVSARSNIHSLGSTIWQFDFAMLWTIWMLYLVEFADWNSQKTIGNGCGNDSATENMGATDSMQYHTGTVQSNRNIYGVGCQYRWIEDLWGNVTDWVDGIYFDVTDIMIIKNPVSFSDASGGTKIGTRLQTANYISAWDNPTVTGFEWALYPSSISGSETTYVCDYCRSSNGSTALHFGGNYRHDPEHGLFFLNGNNSALYTDNKIGCRLQKLP